MKPFILSKFSYLQIPFIFICVFTIINNAKSQYYHQLIGTTAPSSLYYRTGKLGIGTESPDALLHIRSTISTQPLFQIDPLDGFGITTGRIKYFFIDGTQQYGLYQTSQNGLLNYFQDPVRIGNMTLQKGLNNVAQFKTDRLVNQMDFIMDPCEPSCDPFTPLTINPYGIIVRSKLTTNAFQLLTHPGVNNVLVSDADGNGSWTDPSSLRPDFWQATQGIDPVCMHSNSRYQNVGIGTESPMDKLQINDGAHKLSIGSIPNLSTLYGTSYVGFNAAHTLSNWILSPDGEWGHNGGGIIFGDVGGSMYFSTVGSTGGSQQTLSDNDILKNVKLSISPEGKIGIGTISPSRSLEICHSDNQGGMIINQISERFNSTEIRFEKQGVEKFAIGYTVNADRPAFFIWNHIKPGTAMFIDEQNKVGINTEWPAAQLDVNGDFRANAIGIGINPPPSSDSYKLWVEGGIAAREVKVTSGTFPDFVFEKNYQLMGLDSLEQYITIEKHLPDIPSQSEIEKDGGVKIGELQLKLLQKLEEQSLYIISLQKQINELREQMKTKEGK